MQVATRSALFDELYKLSEVKTELKPHQSRVRERIQNQPGLVVAHGLGSGKTLTSIAAQDVLGTPAAVIVPAALQENYLKERDKHLKGSSPEVLLTTLQRVSRRGEAPDQPMLIVDEAHKAREVSTKAYQTLKRNKADKRLLLTASPFYNRPGDIAPLVNLAAGSKVLEADPTEFKKRYISEASVDPGLWARIRGAGIGVEEKLNPKTKEELRDAFKQWVDYHPNSTDGFPEVERTTVPVDMTKKQLQTYDALMGTAPAWVRMKVRAGLPPSKKESKQLNAFVGAVRQISNSTRAYEPGSAPEEPKIETAFQNLRGTLKANPKARAVVYSNYLRSGIEPYKERLDAAGIGYGEFTGEMKKKDRDQMVRNYNAGTKPVLLLSSAGGEGLDLKGTRLIQIMEPHWNSEKLKQVEGRGIRYKSHDHLPKEERKVRVENYVATRPKPSKLRQFFGGKRGGSIDQYLTTMSAKKEKLIQEAIELFEK